MLGRAASPELYPHAESSAVFALLPGASNETPIVSRDLLLSRSGSRSTFFFLLLWALGAVCSFYGTTGRSYETVVETVVFTIWINGSTI